MRSAETSAAARGSREPGSSSSATPRSSATACLGDQQGGDGGVGDPLGHDVAELGAAPGEGADERAHLVVLAELHQAGDRVQLVVELVGLRAQGVGDRQVGAQLALQRHQLGAVAQRRHAADAAARRRRRAPVEHDHPGRRPAPRRPGRRASATGAAGRPRRGSRPRSATRRPTGSPATSSVARAASFIIVTRPSVPTATTPSRMLCSSASRWSARLAISVGASPRVRRLTTARHHVGAEDAEQRAEPEVEREVGGGAGEPLPHATGRPARPRPRRAGRRRRRGPARARPPCARRRASTSPVQPRPSRTSLSPRSARVPDEAWGRRRRAPSPSGRDHVDVGGAREAERRGRPTGRAPAGVAGRAARRPSPPVSWARTSVDVGDVLGDRAHPAAPLVGERRRRLAHAHDAHDERAAAATTSSWSSRN